MQRNLIGIIAVALLLLAATLAMGGWAGDSSQALMAACLRVGVVMTVLWLAEPDLRRMPAWAALSVLAVVALAIIFARRPVHLLVVAAILILAAIVRPRRAGSGARRDR